jgi:hypothetical protein
MCDSIIANKDNLKSLAVNNLLLIMPEIAFIAAKNNSANTM